MPLTATGLDLLTSEQLLAQIELDQRTEFGQEIPQGPTTWIGILNAIFVDALRQCLEGTEEVYSSFDESAATDASLARLGALTGSIPGDATFSTVLADVTVQDGFSYVADDVLASVSGAPDRTFRNTGSFNNPGPGTQVISDVEFRAVDSGPVEAPAGTLTVLSVPVTGIDSLSNPLDAVLGAVEEQDENFRVRRRSDLFRGGNTTVPAIRVNVEDVLRDEGAVGFAVTVFENVSLVVDGDGLPGKSIEVLAYDGTTGGTAVGDDPIGQVIWTSKGGGIESYGSTTVVIVDSIGVSRTVKFSRPTVILVDIEIDVEPGAAYDAATEAKIKSAIVAYGASDLSMGDDVRTALITCAVIDALSLPEEIIDVPEVRISEVPNPPVNANLAIGAREVGDIDTSRILVTTV